MAIKLLFNNLDGGMVKPSERKNKMLYIYNTWLDERTEEEVNAIESCKDLKEWCEECYIGKTESFILNGKEIIADETFEEFLMTVYQDGNDLEVEIPCIDVINIDESYIFDCLIEQINNEEDFGYCNRIFNSENMYIEIMKIIDEITINILSFAIKQLQKKVY